MYQQRPTAVQLQPSFSNESVLTYAPVANTYVEPHAAAGGSTWLEQQGQVPRQRPAAAWSGQHGQQRLAASGRAQGRMAAQASLPGSAYSQFVRVPSGFHDEQQKWEHEHKVVAMMMPNHYNPEEAVAAAAAAATASGSGGLKFQYQPGAVCSFRPAAPNAWFQQHVTSSPFNADTAQQFDMRGAATAATRRGTAGSINVQHSADRERKRRLLKYPDQQSTTQRQKAAALAAAAGALCDDAAAAAAGKDDHLFCSSPVSDDGEQAAAALLEMLHAAVRPDSHAAQPTSSGAQQEQQQRQGSSLGPLPNLWCSQAEEYAAAAAAGAAAAAEASESGRLKRARQPSKKLEAALEQEQVLQMLLEEDEAGRKQAGAGPAGSRWAGPGAEQQQQHRKRRKFMVASDTPVAETVAAKIQYAASFFPEVQLKHAGLKQQQEQAMSGVQAGAGAPADFVAFAAGGTAGPAATQAKAAEAATEALAEAAAGALASAAATAAAAAAGETAAEAAYEHASGANGADANGAKSAQAGAENAEARSTPASAAGAAAPADPAAAADDPAQAAEAAVPAAAGASAGGAADSSMRETVLGLELAAVQAKAQQLVLLAQGQQSRVPAGSPPATSSDRHSGAKNRGGRPKGSGNRTQMVPRIFTKTGQPGFALRSVKYTGVYQSKRAKDGWRAQFCYSNKVLNLGTYESEDDAARAWNAAAVYFRGEQAWLNPAEPPLPANFQPGILQGPAAAVAAAAAIKLAQAQGAAASGVAAGEEAVDGGGS